MSSGYSSSKKTSLIGRFIRLVFSVVVLSALVLGITLGVKNLSVTDAHTLALKVKPLLAMLHVNIDENKVGDVAGKFVERISQTDLGSGVTTSRIEPESANNTISGSSESNKKLLFDVAVLSDIHGDIENLTKALDLAKNKGVSTVFILGDITNYGDITSLNKVKSVLDKSGLSYYVLPGDHDLAQSVSVANFNQVFGQDSQLVQYKGFKFLLFDNSFNFTKISPSQISWLDNNIKGVDFVLLSQPLYTKGLTALFEKIYMGSSSTEPESADLKLKQEEVRDQGTAILSLIRSENNIKAIFAGEHHKSSHLVDPTRSSLEHYVVGAVSSTVNEYPQNILQTPRFSLMSVYDDRSYQVDDVVLN